ncbi:hypothetical protein KW796_00500 [Candidatus Parcubacteria bacterium]|nr:hypothetical protein [Candidatus Parcubacteria bacterium]
MRTRLYVCAALAAVFTLAGACDRSPTQPNITIRIGINNGNDGGVLGTGGGNTPSGCSINLTISGVAVGPSGSSTWQFGERRNYTGSFTTNPFSCAKPEDFMFTSSAPGIIGIDAVTGQATADNTPGQATLCFVYRPDPQNIRACTPPQTVVGPTGGNPSISPIGQISTGNLCQRIFNGAINPPGTAGTWSIEGSTLVTVNPTTGAGSVTQSGVSGSATLVFTMTNGTRITTPLTFVATDCTAPPPTATFTFSLPSICLSTIAGSPTTADFTITVIVPGISNPGVNITSSNTSVVTVVPVGSSTGTTTTWRVTLSGPGNANLTASVLGISGVGSLPVQVLTTACPGGGNSISYSPPGGTVGTTVPNPGTLTSVCILGTGTITCNPFYTSNHPELIDVFGNGVTPINGFNFRTGMTATITRIANTTIDVEICVQWSVTEVSPRFCRNWR